MVRENLRDIPPDYYPANVTPDGPLTFYKGKGCIRCSDTGYIGRSAIGELISVTREIQRLMNNKYPVDEVRAEIKRQGWITMRQDAILKTLEGLTTIDEVLRLARE